MNSGRKSNVIKGVLQMKCPSCGEGDLFEYPMHRIDKVLKMHDACPICNQDYRQEPGFYFGAMYFSYGITIGVMVLFGVGYNILFDPDEYYQTILSVLVPAILIVPFNYRISRTLMLYIFGRIRKAPKSQDLVESKEFSS